MMQSIVASNMTFGCNRTPSERERERERESSLLLLLYYYSITNEANRCY